MAEETPYIVAVAFSIGCMLIVIEVGIVLMGIYTADNRIDEANAVIAQQPQDTENKISEIIYKSNLTQSETIEIINSLCENNKECKIDLLEKHIVER